MTRKSLYVPVLRSRRAEHDALRDITPPIRELLGPIIEVSSTHAKQLRELPPRGMARALTEFAIGCGGTGELYIDLGLLLDHPEAEVICREMEKLILTLRSDAQPVFRVADFSRSGIGAARELLRRNGAAFRVTRDEYASSILNELFRFMRLAKLDFGDVDLFVDCQLMVDGQSMVGTAGLLENDYRWRSVTYIGGSFPPDLSELPKNDEYELPRIEWQSFGRESLEKRNVRYGDYTVQHPFQRDVFFLPSASIRYTSDTYWVVMRGEKPGKPNAPGSEQYIGHAQLLRRRKEFCGREFSAGDAYIDFIADQELKTGNSTKWIQAAVNHHVTLTARQMRAA